MATQSMDHTIENSITQLRSAAVGFVSGSGWSMFAIVTFKKKENIIAKANGKLYKEVLK